MHDVLTATADVTGDGVPDLIGREAATGTRWLYTSDGHGGFTSRRALDTGWGMHDILM